MLVLVRLGGRASVWYVVERERADVQFAGMVSRINDRLAARGKPPVGFINPLLYRAGDVGTDIVDGNNKKKACAAGFPATKGFDAVTGLGTPLWSTLSDVLEAGRYEGVEAR